LNKLKELKLLVHLEVVSDPVHPGVLINLKISIRSTWKRFENGKLSKRNKSNNHLVQNLEV
jgi:hypothetical protein